MTQPNTIADLMEGVLDAPFPFAEALQRAETRTRLDDAGCFLPSALTEQEVHRRAVWALTSQAARAGRQVRLHCAADGSTAYQDVGSRMVVDLVGVPVTRQVQMIGTVPGQVLALEGDHGVLYVVEVRHVLDVEVLP
jgi:hypothetical protein